jgi:hypothetical protein
MSLVNMTPQLPPLMTNRADGANGKSRLNVVTQRGLGSDSSSGTNLFSTLRKSLRFGKPSDETIPKENAHYHQHHHQQEVCGSFTSSNEDGAGAECEMTPSPPRLPSENNFDLNASFAGRSSPRQTRRGLVNMASFNDEESDIYTIFAPVADRGVCCDRV